MDLAYLTDGHRNGRSLVGAIVLVLTDKGQEIVFNTDGWGVVVGFTTILEHDGSRSGGRQSESECVSLRSEFLQQTILFFCFFFR